MPPKDLSFFSLKSIQFVFVAKQGPKTEGILSPSAFVAQRSLRDRLGPKSEMADSTTPGPSAVNITITKPTSGSTQKKSQGKTLH